MSLFRCPAWLEHHHCAGWRGHPGQHYANWTWWPLDGNAPAETRTTFWDPA